MIVSRVTPTGQVCLGMKRGGRLGKDKEVEGDKGEQRDIWYLL